MFKELFIESAEDVEYYMQLANQAKKDKKSKNQVKKILKDAGCPQDILADLTRLFENTQKLTFQLTDSAWYGGHTQIMFDVMDDKKEISVYMERDLANSWISSKSLSTSDIKKLKKEIVAALPNGMKPGSYRFGVR